MAVYLLGILPLACEAIVNGKPADFGKFASAAFIWSLIPLTALCTSWASYFSFIKSNPDYTLDDNSYITSFTAISVFGYAQLPYVAIIPFMMINSWALRLLMSFIAFILMHIFLVAVLRGGDTTISSIGSSPIATSQLTVCAIGILIFNLCLLHQVSV